MRRFGHSRQDPSGRAFGLRTSLARLGLGVFSTHWIPKSVRITVAGPPTKSDKETEEQMIGPVYERNVAVWGRLQKISVYQKSKTVWVAAGKYMGEDHQSEGPTANTAAKRWQQWATYKAKG